MTSTFWALLGFALVLVIGIGIAARKSRAKAAGAAYDRTVPTECAANGHDYRIHDTGWRCTACGNFVSRREGELYGPAEEGRVERRREDR